MKNIFLNFKEQNDKSGITLPRNYKNLSKNIFNYEKMVGNVGNAPTQLISKRFTVSPPSLEE
jgi:hypothetical protein